MGDSDDEDEDDEHLDHDAIILPGAGLQLGDHLDQVGVLLEESPQPERDVRRVHLVMMVISVLVVIMIMVMVMTTLVMLMFSRPPLPHWWPRFPLLSMRQSGQGSTEPPQSPKPIRKAVAVLSQKIINPALIWVYPSWNGYLSCNFCALFCT